MQRLTPDKAASYAHAPILIEENMLLRYIAATQDLVIFPFARNVKLLECLNDTPNAIRYRKSEFATNPKSWGYQNPENYGTRTMLYRQDLIQFVDVDDGDGMHPGLFELTVTGKSALLAVQQQFIWSSKRGILREQTRKFYDYICEVDLERPLLWISKPKSAPVVSKMVGYSYKISRKQLEELTTHPQMRKRPGYKAFAQKLILSKLEGL